jgi:hypothetical protein
MSKWRTSHQTIRAQVTFVCGAERHRNTHRQSPPERECGNQGQPDLKEANNSQKLEEVVMKGHDFTAFP